MAEPKIAPYGSWKSPITTDLIVGFPGETEEDFLETLSLVEKVEFDSAFIFTYSPRPGTPAMNLTDDVSREEKDRRLQTLLAAQRAISFKKNRLLIGREVEVLFEGRTRRDANRFYGRTREFKRVVASSEKDIAGQFHKARIASVADETLLGELIT